MKAEMPTPEAVNAALKSLGNTPQEVANALRKQGIKGIPQSADCCPIANFLVHKFGRSFGVGCVTWWEDYWKPSGCKGKMPCAIQDFIDAFDRGTRYQYLRKGEKKMRRVYISVPMTGKTHEEITRMTEEASLQLKAAGFEVVNPHETPDVRSCERCVDYRATILADLRALATCDAIYLCDGWDKSLGCTIEFQAFISGVPMEFGERFRFRTLPDACWVPQQRVAYISEAEYSRPSEGRYFFDIERARYALRLAWLGHSGSESAA